MSLTPAVFKAEVDDALGGVGGESEAAGESVVADVVAADGDIVAVVERSEAIGHGLEVGSAFTRTELCSESHFPSVGIDGGGEVGHLGEPGLGPGLISEVGLHEQLA